MNEIKILSLLGMAKKAGKTVCGTDMTVESIRKNASSVKVVITASDSSDGTVKRIVNTASYYGVDVIPLAVTKEKLGHLLGCGAELSVVGVKDSGFAAAVKKAAQDETNGAS